MRVKGGWVVQVTGLLCMLGDAGVTVGKAEMGDNENSQASLHP